ncbi:hypothetical protein LLG10_08500 [bacterium]|nr:hypothetical protein [bacterium]
MLQQATELGHLWYQWVTGDSAYGESHDVRHLVASLGKWYCFEMKSNTHVWIKDPAWKVPTQKRERVRVIESQERKPGPPAWLMIRRSVEDPSEIKYRGWYHHITLSLMALFFLKMVQKQW